VRSNQENKLMIFRFIKSLFENPKDTCISLYHEAKHKRPGKDEKDYFKLILLTKPPFDYQHDGVIEIILREHDTIESLADYIVELGTGKSLYQDSHFAKERSHEMWERRKVNLSLDFTKKKLEARNNKFFKDFWS
jgi:hypothetical protein